MNKKLHEERLKVLEKIAEFEKEGKFDQDVEDDPESKTLEVDDVDYLYTKPINKFKNKLGVFFGNCLRKYARKHFKTTVYNIEKLPNLKSGCFITLNHFDTLDSGCASEVIKHLDKNKKLYIIIKEGNYFFKGMNGFLFRYCDTLPLSSSIKTMKKFNEAVKKVLDNGDYILIYPEQAMWYNYEKPRPIKNGAGYFAAKYNVPIIPLFTCLTDQEKVNKNGFNEKQYHVFIEDTIYPDESLSVKENASIISNKIYVANVKTYESFYKKKVSYNNEEC